MADRETDGKIYCMCERGREIEREKFGDRPDRKYIRSRGRRVL